MNTESNEVNEVEEHLGEVTARAKPTVAWRDGRTLQVEVSKYVENDNTCIVLVSEEGVVELKCTTNLGPLPPHEFYIKNYSENRGVEDLLVSSKVIVPLGRDTVYNGSVQFNLHTFADGIAELFGIPVPEATPPFAADHEAAQEASSDADAGTLEGSGNVMPMPEPEVEIDRLDDVGEPDPEPVEPHPLDEQPAQAPEDEATDPVEPETPPVA